MRPTVWMLLLCALPLGSVGGCHRATRAPAAIVSPDAELERAMGLFRRGDFRRALQILERLGFEFAAGQPQVAQVRYYVAECYFQLGDRTQAAIDFRKVADQFSTSEYGPLALLRAGDSNLRLWRKAELDPTYGETALAIYQELTGRYPESEAAVRARPHILRLENQFAEKTYRNGMFYLRRKAYDSAIIYFKDVVASFPHARRTPDALLRLVDTYRAIRYTQELQETCAHLRRFYPQAAGLDRSCPATSDTTATPS